MDKQKDHFYFKQFSVYQKDATLKVCTDSCLFGAWLSSQEIVSHGKALDIGTGTGLLALMFAQNHPHFFISAIEIDEKATVLAHSNFQNSPWAYRLESIHTSLQAFVKQYSSPIFDVIFCNPPFFEEQLLSPNKVNNLAKHSSQLTKFELIKCISVLLTDHGKAYLLYPPSEADDFISLALSYGLYASHKVTVSNREQTAAIRVLLCFEKRWNQTKNSHICIYNSASHQEYSREFATLLQPYYLNILA
jgi:tRNA1Val (adenine37-N6)-methyltransferase